MGDRADTNMESSGKEKLNEVPQGNINEVLSRSGSLTTPQKPPTEIL